MEEEVMMVESWEDEDGRTKTEQIMGEIGKLLDRLTGKIEQLAEAAREEGNR